MIRSSSLSISRSGTLYLVLDSFLLIFASMVLSIWLVVNEKLYNSMSKANLNIRFPVISLNIEY